MDIEKIEVGKEYILLNPGKGNQKVKVTQKRSNEISVVYTSDDCTKGMRTTMNDLECERYLRKI